MNIILQEKFALLPQKYETEVINYIDYLIEKERKEQEDKNVSSFFGCLEKGDDPLEIQRRLRDEWDD